MHRTLALFALPLALSACFEHHTPLPAEPPTESTPGSSCAGVAVEVDDDEVTPMGFAAQDLIDVVNVGQITQVDWADGPERIAMAVEVTLDGPATYTHEEWVSHGSEERSGTSTTLGRADCPEYVSIDGTLTLRSEDSRLQETFDVTYRSVDGLTVQAFVVQDPATLVGMLDFDAFHSEDDLAVHTLHIEANFDEDGTFGTVWGTAEGEGEESGTADTAWFSRFDIAVWGSLE